jgi:hypothetical protein
MTNKKLRNIVFISLRSGLLLKVLNYGLTSRNNNITNINVISECVIVICYKAYWEETWIVFWARLDFTLRMPMEN